ncbi:MAG TPA: class I SAM-dependent methyltransferase [Streptosporangiaceae bacterium]
MVTQAERAMSFGAIADDYDRLRPDPAPDAIRWLVPDGTALAVDLAAGTGKLSRALTARQVLAVEPDGRMAAVLRARTPGVRVVSGVGEALPLRDGSADGLFISSAWHWMTPGLAVPEIARVLRDGGRFGVIWTSRDREVDWVRELDRLREPSMQSSAGQPTGPTPDGDTQPPSRHVRLPEGSPFTAEQGATFTFTRTMAVADIVDMLATNSRIITAQPADRDRALGRLRDALGRWFPGTDRIDVPMRSICWRADRLPRR